MFDNLSERFMDQFILGDGLDLMLKGLVITIEMSAIALVIGIAIGTLMALLKIAKGKTVAGKFFCSLGNIVAKIYITIFRGTPVVVQLLLAYFGIFGPLGVNPLYVGFCVLGCNSGAYVAEIIRGGIQSIDKGQYEAGRSLGLSYRATMFRIIIPQAVKNILPALGNELIALIKETSVVGFISVFDMTRAARSIISTHYDALVPYLVLAASYLTIVLIATFLVGRLERGLSKSDRG